MSLKPPTEGTPSTATFESRVRSVESGIGTVSLRALGADHTGTVAADSYFAAAAADGRPIDLGGVENTFKISAAFAALTSGARVVANGATVDMSGVAAGSDGYYRAFNIRGTPGSKVLLSSDVARGGRTCVLPSVAGLAVGDKVQVGTDGPRSRLASGIADASTTASIVLLDASGFASSGSIRVENEIIAYTGKSTNTLTGITRAQEGTSGAAHASDAFVTERSSLAYYPAHGSNPTTDRGEIKVIQDITGTTITFEDELYDSYTTARGAFLRKLNMVEDVEIKGVRFISDNDPSSQEERALDLYLCDDIRILGCDFSDLNARCVSLMSCTNFLVDGCTFAGSDGGDSLHEASSFYGVAMLDSCQWGRVIGSHATRLRRHSVVTAHTCGQDWYGQPRFIEIVGNTGTNLYREMFEQHGHGEGIDFSHNVVDGCDGLARIEGGGVSVTHNEVFNWRLHAITTSDLVDARSIDISHNQIYAPSSNVYVNGRAIYMDMTLATAIKDVSVDFNKVFDFPNTGIGAITDDGTLASDNYSMTGNKVTCTGTRTTYAIDVDTPGMTVEDNKIKGSRYGIRANGDDQIIDRNKIILASQEATAGNAIEITASNQVVTRNYGRFTFVALRCGATCVSPLVERNTFRVPSATRLLSDGGVTTPVFRDNTYLLDSGQVMTVAAAATLTLPVPGNHRWTITGNTNTTTIAIQAEGTEVTLVFSGTPIVTNGGIMQLAADFPAANGRTLTLVSNGTNWYEKARKPAHLSGTATWDPASIADGAMTSTTVTVTGAVLGQPVFAGFNASGGVPAGAILSAAITAADTATVTLFNKTGSALDLGSGTLRVAMLRVP